MFEREKVLMIIKTYPTPSTSYGELVCTAGIRLSDNSWIRIYPFPFRQGNDGSQFKKWEIIEVDITKADNRDRRPESYRLHDIATLKRTEILDTSKNWALRMPFIRATALDNVKVLLDGIPLAGDQEWGRTIGPVAIKPGARFIYKRDRSTWSEKDQLKLAQMASREAQDLFSDPESARALTQLEKMPYKFYLVFQDLSDTEYTFKILDWEICVLYRNELRRLGSEEAALESVRYKIEEQICSARHETFIFLGNINHQYKQRQLVVDGFVYPKRATPSETPPQEGLF